MLSLRKLPSGWTPTVTRIGIFPESHLQSRPSSCPPNLYVYNPGSTTHVSYRASGVNSGRALLPRYLLIDDHYSAVCILPVPY